MKKKLSYVPFNLLSCLSSFIIPLYALSNLGIPNENYICYTISFMFYFLDVKYQTDVNYLEDRIKNMELNKEDKKIN